MDNLGYGKWAGWIALSLLSLVVNVISQPGFLSLNCGGKTNTTAQNGITWMSDANYIDVGNTTDIYPDASVQHNESLYGFSLYSLRFFPKPLSKSCYQFPVVPDVPYLLRLTFALGNYSGDQQSQISFGFSIETLGLLFFSILEFTDSKPQTYEYVTVSSGSVLYICLIRTSTDNPFINAIELRTLRKGMYKAVQPGTILRSMKRYNVGGNSQLIRYPQDKFDRLWSLPPKIPSAVAVSTRHLISVNNTEDFPPTAMMQTAWVVNSSQTDRFRFSWAAYTGKTLVVLYFAEIETPNTSESRSFEVEINGIKRSDNITLVRNYSALDLTFASSNSYSIDIVKASNSTLGPIINAYEYNRLQETQQATSSQDVEALNAIKSKFHIKDWISDPCFLIEWEGIGCDNSSYMFTRIWEMNLSGWNLTGSIPEHIGQLTALVNLSLDNNHLVGSLPNFSNLTMLQRLYLHNNNLSGSVPEWLSELKNLKELFIENNNFSGVIPAQLFNEFMNNSLKLIYSGNTNLFKPLPSSKKSKVGVILGITLSGILIIAIALIVGTAFYRKKLSRKEGVLISVLDPEISTVMDAEYSTVMMPNPTKSRAFTRKEISAATQNFSKKIGRGGFGWVFLGQLPEGKEIAVKVLSLFSTQGVHEFLNEVTLLSRIHHRNLVSLLGYCNEYNEHMLIYEYMCGGCFRDHLYGDNERFSQLNWTKRVKIALDAAQGLEYLHVGCTPKIIHRDVKTANILLDNNLNGKLADFGLSRMTFDGDASHVTTVVKGTFGYFDPEYFNTQNLTEKSDVYSFGVVLFEIICGRQPIDINLPEEEVNLIRWVTPYMEMDENYDKIENIIDKRLGDNYDIKSITRVAKLAIKCVQPQPSSRPNVTEVVAELKEASKHDNDASKGIGAYCTYSRTQSSGPEELIWSDSDNTFEG